MLPGPARERDHVAPDRVFHPDVADRLLKIRERGEVGEGLARDPALLGSGREDPLLLCLRWIAEPHAQQESVELRLGQRKRALELDRILRRQHEEGLGQGIGGAVGRHLMLLHGFQQRRLGLRRRPVDLVGEQDLCEQWTSTELELVRAQVEDRRAGDVGRHQIRRELDAPERQAQKAREHPHEGRLPDAGDVVDEDVRSRQDADQHEPQRLPHPVQPLVDSAGDLVGELPGTLEIGHGSSIRRGGAPVFLDTSAPIATAMPSRPSRACA